MIQNQSEQVSGGGGRRGEWEGERVSKSLSFRAQSQQQHPISSAVFCWSEVSSKSSPYTREGITHGCAWGEAGRGGGWITESLLEGVSYLPGLYLFKNHNSLVREVLLPPLYR